MQSPDFSQNYFELFGLKPVFDIDERRLQAEQQRLQASMHPDRFVRASDQEKRISVQLASFVNQAYSTLQDPVKRAHYLLEIRDVRLPDDATTTSDSGFLMEQIELREEIDACREGEDALSRCEQIATRLQRRFEQLATEFVASFESEDFENALVKSRNMQFIQRVQQQLSELQFELEDY